MAHIRKSWAILGISTASALALAIGCAAREGDAGEGSGANLSASEDLVISQVYGGGGNAGGPFKNDFVELFNRGSKPVTLTGKALQYTSANFPFGAAGSTTTDLPEASLAPGQYFLIKLNGKTPPDPAAVDLPRPDADMAFELGSKDGKVAIVPKDDPLADCGTRADAGSLCADGKWIDLVGYGTKASQFEGTAATDNLDNKKAAIRNGGGCQDEGDNKADFTVGAPTPRNSDPANVHVCAAVVSGSDAGDASPGDASPADASPTDPVVDSGTDSGIKDASPKDASPRGDASPRRDAGRRDASFPEEGDDDDDGEGSDEDYADDPVVDSGRKPKPTPLRTGASDCSMTSGPVEGNGGLAAIGALAFALASFGSRRRSRAAK